MERDCPLSNKAINNGANGHAATGAAWATKCSGKGMSAGNVQEKSIWRGRGGSSSKVWRPEKCQSIINNNNGMNFILGEVEVKGESYIQCYYRR